MKVKEVIHLITTIERGGAEKQLLILAREQLKLGIKVNIIYLKGKPELKDLFEEAGCTVYSQLADKVFYKQVLLLSRLIHNKKILLHAHLPQAELVAAFATNKNGFIFTRHNSEFFWPSGPKIFSIVLSRFVCARSSSGIAISKAVKDFVFSNKEIPKGFQIEVIHYGYDANPFISHDGLKQISKKLPRSSNTKIIGAIGRLVDQKNYPILLKAFKAALKDYENIHLVIVGDGSNQHELMNLSKELKITKKITWLGRTNYIPEVLSKIDVFVLSSNYEGFGLVLLEAMVAKKPILASNNSSIPEVLGLNYMGLFQTGSYQDLSVKILKVLNDSKFEKDLKRNYEKQLIQFDPERMAKKIKRTYEKTFVLQELKAR